MKVLGFIVLFVWVCSVVRKVVNTVTMDKHVQFREKVYLKAKKIASENNKVQYYIAYIIVLAVYITIIYLSVKGLSVL